jgi:ATP-dependent Clp protease ATP-binding subunit ClpC
MAEVFERFTDRARTALQLAQEEARLLKHSFIGTEHLLLGLIHEGNGVAAKALEHLGISLEAVRTKVEETIGLSGTAPTGSPPFTPRAKKVLELSLREALQLGHNYIGTEHILLGLVGEGEGVAAQVLVSLGADLNRVRDEVLRRLSGLQTKPTRSVPREAEAQRGSSARIRRRLGFEPEKESLASQNPPDCPNCRSSLRTSARSYTLTVPDEGGEAHSEFLVVYCTECGQSLAFKPI